MHLINTNDFRVKEFDTPEKYGILSHRWGGNEITFEQFDIDKLPQEDRTELSNPSKPANTGLSKIAWACKKARAKNIEWFWIDTCCINKEDPRERDKNLNAMYRYYGEAVMCFAYLPDVTQQPEEYSSKTKSKEPFLTSFEESEWWTRAWTLQELLAPRMANFEFFDYCWESTGTKGELADRIHQIARIEPRVSRRQSRRSLYRD